MPPPKPPANVTFDFWYSDDQYWTAVAQTIHTILGYVGVVFNVSIIYVVYKTGTNGLHLIATLAWVDIAKCVNEIVDSTFRLKALLQTSFGKPVYMPSLLSTHPALQFSRMPKIMCLLSPAWHGDIIFFSFNQFVTMAIAFERLIAVFKPMWYNKEWSGKNEKRYHMIVYSYGLLMMTLHYVPNIFDPFGYTFIGCPMPRFMKPFNTSTRLLYAFTAATVTTIAVLKGKSMLKEFATDQTELANRLQRLNRTAMVVVGINTVLIAIPNGYQFMAERKLVESSLARKSIVWCLENLNSTINFVVMLAINADFRKRTKEAFSTGNSKKPELGGQSSRNVQNANPSTKRTNQKTANMESTW